MCFYAHTLCDVLNLTHETYRENQDHGQLQGHMMKYNRVKAWQRAPSMAMGRTVLHAEEVSDKFMESKKASEYFSYFCLWCECIYSCIS